MLTTLLSYRISAADKDTEAFADTPTALKTVFGRLDDWLQANPTKPIVSNPFLASENFADAWNDDQYANFREKIQTYREWIDDAFNEQDRNESIAKWRHVFGEDFASSVVLAEAKAVSANAVAVIKRTIATASTFSGDLVEALRHFGARALPQNFDHQAHMQSPTWRRATQTISVQVRAEHHQSKNGRQLGAVQSLEPLPAGSYLHFKAVTNTGMPISSNEYRVEWRITNTDVAASNADDLRGGFSKPESDNSKWEELRYRGVHLAEAFVIRKRDERLVGKSAPFRVVIE